MSVHDEDVVISWFHWRGRWGGWSECQRYPEGESSHRRERAAADLAKGRTPFLEYLLQGYRGGVRYLE